MRRAPQDGQNPRRLQLKAADDQHDAFWLAHLMRLNILPTGYIYPKEDRSTRDLLRLRQKLVQQRTSLGAQRQKLDEMAAQAE